MDLKNLHRHKLLLITTFLVFFVLFFLIQNYFFLKQNTKPVYTDGHILRAAKYYDVLTLKNFHDLSMIEYPPFPYLVTQIFFHSGGFSIESLLISTLLFSLIFLLAMFGIGYELGGSYAGAVVLAIAASSSHILDHSRQYYPDFPQTAVTALAFYFLLKTNFFKDRKFSIIFGITLALSFLSKWSTGFFMIVPVLWYLFPSVINWRKNKTGSLVFLILTLIAAGGTTWYFWNINPGDKLLTKHWFIYYSLFILIPGIISTGIVYFNEIKNKEYFNDWENTSMNNFTLMSVAFSSLAGLWYFFAGEAIKMKFYMLTLDTVVFEGQSDEISSFLQSIFNLFPFWHILAVIGLIMIFIHRKNNFYRNLLLPVNIIFVTLLMLKITCPGSRYLLSIIIFAAALAGYWIPLTNRFKPVITIIIIFISLVSTISWTMIYLNLPQTLYSGTSKYINIKTPLSHEQKTTGLTIFIANYPTADIYRKPSENVIREMFFGEDPCNRLLILFTSQFERDVFPHEFFQFEIFRITGKIQADFDWATDEFFRTVGDRWRSSTPLFVGIDFNDKFTDKIKNGNDRLSIYLRKYLSSDSLDIINKHIQGNKLDLHSRKVLADDLNRLIYSRNLLKEKEIINPKERKDIENRLEIRSLRSNYIILNRRLLESQYPKEIIRKYNPDSRLDWACRSIDGVVILHKAYQKTDKMEKHILSFFPGKKLIVKTYDIGKNFCITTIKIR